MRFFFQEFLAVMAESGREATAWGHRDSMAVTSATPARAPQMSPYVRVHVT